MIMKQKFFIIQFITYIHTLYVYIIYIYYIHTLYTYIIYILAFIINITNQCDVQVNVLMIQCLDLFKSVKL